MATAQTVDAGNDPACQPGPSDTVRQLKWSPTTQNEGQFPLFLASWDWGGKTGVYEINGQGTNRQVIEKTNQWPALSISWMPDGQQLVTGLADNSVNLWDLKSNQIQKIGQHQAPVHDAVVIAEMGTTMAVSMDGNMHVWDHRSPQPVNTQNMQSKIIGLQIVHPLAVIACLDNTIHCLDLRNIGSGWTRHQETQSNAFNQGISCFAISADAAAVALGSYEGRLSAKKIQVSPHFSCTQDYNFRCHMESATSYATKQAFPINAAWYYKNGAKALVTGGGDAKIDFWDMQGRTKIKGIGNLSGPVTALDVNKGSFLAYAIGYDWYKGIEGIQPIQNKICYRHLGPDFMPKSGPTTGGYRR